MDVDPRALTVKMFIFARFSTPSVRRSIYRCITGFLNVGEKIFCIYSVCALLFLVFLGGKVYANVRPGGLPVPPSLKQILIKNGISQETITRCIRSGKASVNLDLILKNLRHQEKKEDYRPFLTKESLDQSRWFLHHNRTLLRKVERHYGVPSEIIVAILRVESDFGRNHERYNVLNVYTSLASLADPKIRRELWHRVADTGYPMSTGKMRLRMMRKAAWGVKELTCLLQMEEQGTLNVFTLKGSWAGAFGMPQFVPTSFDRYGVDWDQDGKIRLDQLPDAAASIAYYLKVNGWHPPMNLHRMFAVIKTYNHSQPYADTVLRLSQKLRVK